MNQEGIGTKMEFQRKSHKSHKQKPWAEKGFMLLVLALFKKKMEKQTYSEKDILKKQNITNMKCLGYRYYKEILVSIWNAPHPIPPQPMNDPKNRSRIIEESSDWRSPGWIVPWRTSQGCPAKSNPQIFQTPPTR